MKKFLIGLALALATMGAQASYLFWQVTGNEAWTSGGGSTLSAGLNDYTITSIYVTDGSQSLTSYYSTGEATGTINQYFPGVDNVYVQTTDITDGGSYSYFIEIMGYKTAGAGESPTSEVIARSATFTYADMNGHFTDTLPSMSSLSDLTAMVGSSYAAPEPTSGLLLLVGGALLALRRRRA